MHSRYPSQIPQWCVIYNRDRINSDYLYKLWACVTFFTHKSGNPCYADSQPVRGPGDNRSEAAPTLRELRYDAWTLGQRNLTRGKVTAKPAKPKVSESDNAPKREPIRSTGYGKPGYKPPMPKRFDSGRTESDIVHASGAIVVRNVRVTARMSTRNTGDHSTPSLDDRSHNYETVNGWRPRRKRVRRTRTPRVPAPELVTPDSSNLDKSVIEHAKAVAAS